MELARGRMTLVRPARGAPSSFPSDLFEQARGRLRLLAGFFIVAYAFDLLKFVGVLIFARDVSPETARTPELQWVNLGAVLLSAVLWWAAKSPRISASRIHTLGLVYEVLVCFISAMLTYRQSYVYTGVLPNLTWVPAIVIMFPPGPPRRMLGAAIASAAMSPLALFLLDLIGKIDTGDGSAYAPATVGRFSESRSRTWARASSTASGAKWRRRARWGAINWRRNWGRVAWATYGGRVTACSPGPRPSSSSGPRAAETGTRACRRRRCAAHGQTRLHRRHADRAPHAAHFGGPRRAVGVHRAAGARIARQPRAVVPGEGPREAAAVGARAFASPGRYRGRGRVDRGALSRLVGPASADARRRFLSA